MHYLYILKSENANRFYIGETSDIKGRLVKHQSHFYNASFTRIASDWKVVLAFECLDKDSAIFLEGFIKRMKSKKFIEKIINNEKILSDLLLKKSVTPGSPEASGPEVPL